MDIRNKLMSLESIVLVNSVTILGIIAQLIKNGIFSASWYNTILLLAIGYSILLYLPEIKKKVRQKW